MPFSWIEGVELVKDMYIDVTCAKTPVGISSDFPNTKGLHLESSFKLIPFALVVDERTKYMQKEIPEYVICRQYSSR